ARTPCRPRRRPARRPPARRGPGAREGAGACGEQRARPQTKGSPRVPAEEAQEPLRGLRETGRKKLRAPTSWRGPTARTPARSSAAASGEALHAQRPPDQARASPRQLPPGHAAAARRGLPGLLPRRLQPSDASSPIHHQPHHQAGQLAL
ncbi:hypothetical protein P7K49_037801, partial [Saguinus oedipus]